MPLNPTQTELTIRDIQLPEAISWWPLAWGWWALLVAIMVLIFCVLALTKYISLRKAQSLAPEPIRPILQREVVAIHHLYQKNKDDTWLAQQLAQVLRKTVILESPQSENNALARLTGVDWLHALNRHFNLQDAGKKQGFVSKLGLALIEAPYRPHYEYDGESLVKLAYFALAQPQTPPTPNQTEAEENSHA